MATILSDEVGRFFSIRSLGLKEAELQINLEEYITSSKNRFTSPANDQLFIDARKDLAYQVSSFNAVKLWDMMLDQATIRLSTEEIDEIKAAPVSQFLAESFVELVKNAIDVAIMNGQTEIKLTLNVDNQSNPDNVTLTLQDNGPGFPDKFINDFKQTDKRYEYIDGKGSPKHGIDNNIQAALLGGAGRGLRRLMAQMEHGDKLVAAGVRVPEYTRPEGTKMELDKRPDGLAGAYISLTTSKKQWEKIPEKPLQESEKEIVASMMTFDFNKFKSRAQEIKELESNEENKENNSMINKVINK